MKQTYGVIYGIRNQLTGKFYIGQTTQLPQRRIASHLRSSSSLKLKRSILKNGKGNFVWGIISYGENKVDLNEKERFYIKNITLLKKAIILRTEEKAAGKDRELPEIK